MTWQRWQSGTWSACRRFMLSSTFQLATQLAVGLFLAALVVFVRPLSFPQACTSAYLYLVIVVTTSPNNHIGTRITAVASMLGPVWMATIFAGIVGTLSRLADGGAAVTALEALLSCLVLAVLAINRVGSQPPVLSVVGLNSCLVYGLTMAAVHNVPSTPVLWGEAVGGMCLAALWAAASALATSVLVLPTLASDGVPSTLSKVVLSAAACTSSTASLLFPQSHTLPPDMQQHAAQARACGLMKHLRLAGQGEQYLFDPEDEEGYMQWLEIVTQPTNLAAAKAPVAATPGLPLSKSMAALNQRSSSPAAAKGGSSVRPPAGVSRPGTTDLDVELGVTASSSCTAPMQGPLTAEEGGARRSGAVIRLPRPSMYRGALQDPVTAAMGLRPLLASASTMLVQSRAEPALLRSGSSGFQPASWSGVISGAQLLVTRLAAFQTLLEEGELINEDNPWSPTLPGTFRLVLGQLAASLACTAEAIEGSCSRHRASSVAPFCISTQLFGRTWAACSQELKQEIQVAVQQHWREVVDAPQSLGPGGHVQEMRLLFYCWTLCNGLIQAVEELEQAVAGAVCGPGVHEAAIAWEQRDLRAWLALHTCWLQPLVPLLTNKFLWVNWWRVASSTVPVALKSRAGFVTLLLDRYFQAGAKYWFGLSLVLAAVLLYQHLAPQDAHYTPVIGFVAACVSLSERVEATASKVSFWLLGSTSGAALGLGAMSHPAVANNPYLLVAIMTVTAALVGLAGRTQFRTTSVLTLMSVCALILCQYVGCCGATGAVDMFVVRTVAVWGSLLLSAALSNVLLPWYTSAWALDTLAGLLIRSVGLLQDMYDRFYADSQAAVLEATSDSDGHAARLSLLLPQLSSPRRSSTVAAAAAALPQEDDLDLVTISNMEALAAPSRTSPMAVAATSSGAHPAGGVDVLDPMLLQSPSMSGCLVAVQVSLVKDATAWKRGVLATPNVVWVAHRQLLEVLDALAALQTVLRQGPTVTGAFCGNAFLSYLQPMHTRWQAASDHAALLAAATATHLCAPSKDSEQKVVTELEGLLRVRCDFGLHQALLHRQLRSRVWQRIHQQTPLPALAGAGLVAADDSNAAPVMRLPCKAPREARESPSTSRAASALHTTGLASPFEDNCSGPEPQVSPATATTHPLMLQGAASTCTVVDTSDMDVAGVLTTVGGVDDIIAFMSFQAAWIKVLNKVAAAARGAVLTNHTGGHQWLAWIK